MITFSRKPAASILIMLFIHSGMGAIPGPVMAGTTAGNNHIPGSERAATPLAQPVVANVNIGIQPPPAPNGSPLPTLAPAEAAIAGITSGEAIAAIVATDGNDKGPALDRLFVNGLPAKGSDAAIAAAAPLELNTAPALTSGSINPSPAQKPKPAVTGKLQELPPYKKAAIGWKEKLASIARQLLALPATLRRIHKIIKEEYTPAAFNENLWALRGFLLESNDPHYRARRWDKIALSAIQSSQLLDIPVWGMAAVMSIAREVEDPILGYTHQSGQGYRFLLPNLGRFMGKNEEQARYAEENHLPWCESPWCAEERRHGPAFARMIEQLTRTTIAGENPYKAAPVPVAEVEAQALRHLISRETTEWNASSIYVALAAHSQGELKDMITNIMRDEIKHLSILSAADVYFWGRRPWRRFKHLLRRAIFFFNDTTNSSTEGDNISSVPVVMLEVAAAHLLAEYHIRQWLKTVPLSTLAAVFESPSNLPELPAFKLPPEKQAAVDELMRRGKEKRVQLRRWLPEQREQALEQRGFEEKQAPLIESIIASSLGDFHGAEIPGSARELQIRQLIWRLNPKNLKGRDILLLRKALIDRLLDYQIRNNRHVLAR